MKSLILVLLGTFLIASCRKNEDSTDPYVASLPSDPLLALEQIDKDWESGKISVIGTAIAQYSSFDMTNTIQSSNRSSTQFECHPYKSRLESYKEAPWGDLVIDGVKMDWKNGSYSNYSSGALDIKLMDLITTGSIPLNFSGSPAFSTAVNLPKEITLTEKLPGLTNGGFTLKWNPTGDNAPIYLVLKTTPDPDMMGVKFTKYYQLTDNGSFTLNASDIPSNIPNGTSFKLELYRGKYELQKIDALSSSQYFLTSGIITKSHSFTLRR